MSENRLAQETSPYLRQHKDNPVHWQAWGDAAFEAARERDLPILLSIGYAACHWCHVMAHESFEDPDVAAEMNKRFINIKVDREERPDVDSIYQTALQLLGEHGGWPLTMFLTPDGAPFWGGTYFPKVPGFGRPGFGQVLRSISETYSRDKARIADNVTAIKDGLDKAMVPVGGGVLTLTLLDEVAAMALRLIDTEFGGTAGAPKFPQPMFFRLLWNAHLRTGHSAYSDAVRLTLDSICQGGIYDHLGGGFARYSTDERWLAPHFEKMLYDNALLIELLSDVALTTRSTLYARRVEESITWLLREMQAEHDGDGRFAFAGALDADSEGEEGRFYVWDADEIADVLGADVDRFAKQYDVTPDGNWENKTILNRLRTMDWDDDTEHAMAPLRDALLAKRAERIRPGRDDKVLADWNGLVIAALARAAIAFDRPDWTALAADVFDWVASHMTAADGRLRHSMCNGRLQHPAVLDDYANMSRAAVIMYEITGDTGYLETAIRWIDGVDAHYHDPESGGYFMAAADTPGLVARPKPIHDNAQPAANGIIAEVLVRLYLMTGEPRFRARAQSLFDTFTPTAPQNNLHQPTLLGAWELLNRGSQIVIVGPPADPRTAELIRHALATPNRLSVVSRIEPGQTLPDGHAARGKTMVDGQPTAYVCIGPTCGLPITEPDHLIKALERPA